MSGAELDTLRNEAARLRVALADLEQRLAAAESEAALRFAGTAGQRRRFIAYVWHAFLGRDPSAADIEHLVPHVGQVGPLAYVTELVGTPEATRRRAAAHPQPTDGQRRRFVTQVWQAFLGRQPSPPEIEHLALRVETIGALAFVAELAGTHEAAAHLAARPRTATDTA